LPQQHRQLFEQLNTEALAPSQQKDSPGMNGTAANGRNGGSLMGNANGLIILERGKVQPLMELPLNGTV
jgi:hypothetical protein